jgi:acyl dehydratase
MQNESLYTGYYNDTWTEDGAAAIGYRRAGLVSVGRTAPRRFSEVIPGAALPGFERGPVTRTHIVKYAGASWDFNPIHHDEPFAKRARSGGIIAHGMMVLGYLGSLATAYLGTAAIDKFSGRLLEVTRPGDTLRIEGRVERATPSGAGGVVVLSLTATKLSGAVVAAGTVTATLPG